MAIVRLIVLLCVASYATLARTYEYSKLQESSINDLKHKEDKSGDSKTGTHDEGPCFDSKYDPGLESAAAKSLRVSKQSTVQQQNSERKNCSERHRRSDAKEIDLITDEKIQGFNAMRGRRGQGFNAMRGRRNQGFNAMRGRRADEVDYQGFNAMRGRRTQGFSAMRGRRDQGFNAMRGRRDQGFNAIRGRRDQGFSAMSGRRIENSDNLDDRVIRQAGFSAMRGKRVPITSDRYIVIRGRRDKESFADSDTRSDTSSANVKRAAFSPSAGSFSAMRGKKDNVMKA